MKEQKISLVNDSEKYISYFHYVGVNLGKLLINNKKNLILFNIKLVRVCNIKVKGGIMLNISNTPSFFNVKDIIKYSKYAGQTYRKKNPGDVKIGIEIREKLYDKTNYWLDSVSVPGYYKRIKYNVADNGLFCLLYLGKNYLKKKTEINLFILLLE